MSLNALDKSILENFNRQALEISKKLNTDVVIYLGEIDNISPLLLRNVLEESKKIVKTHSLLS